MAFGPLTVTTGTNAFRGYAFSGTRSGQVSGGNNISVPKFNTFAVIFVLPRFAVAFETVTVDAGSIVNPFVLTVRASAELRYLATPPDPLAPEGTGENRLLAIENLNTPPSLRYLAALYTPLPKL